MPKDRLAEAQTVAVHYPEFGDFCDVAADVLGAADILGTTPEQIARFPNAGLAARSNALGAVAQACAMAREPFSQKPPAGLEPATLGLEIPQHGRV